MNSKLDVPLHGHSLNIVRQSREALCEVLQSKFGCVAFIEGLDSDHDFGYAHKGKPTVEDWPRFAFMLRAGVQVSVWKGDLTIFKADAVVNAANTQLQHAGGLASALCKAGGPDVQRESNDYIRKHGDLKTGDAIVAGPGHLPCKHIIHAVGPRLPLYPTNSDISRAEPLLKEAIRSILDKVRERRLQSVAIPAISSGLFHYPLPQCADTIVSAVKEYYENYGPYKDHPKEIFLVNHDEPSVTEMTRACKQILAPHNAMTYSQVAASNSKDDAKTSTPSLQMGKVDLKLLKGNIEEQWTDVIVNTTGEDRNLSSGNVSSALLNKAGYEIQKELHYANQTGPVIITKAYRLHCKNVFHTFCAWKGGDAMQILSNSVLECLRLAVSNNHKSIAFPAIGTGNLGFRAKEVAYIMLSAVSHFAQNTSKTLEVHVVIYPPDINTFQAFEEQMRYPKEKVSGPSFEPAFNNKDDFSGSKASFPQISLTGSSEEATREAERWLQGLFGSSGTVVLCNNFILHFGEQEHQQLSRLTKRGVRIQEYFQKGFAGITVKGELNEEVAVAGLQVEAILCKIQEEFVRDEEQEISRISTKNVSFQRETLHSSTQEYRDRTSLLSKLNLWMYKVEKVENPALETLFELKKKQLNRSTSRTMFQCISAQFLEMVCRIGFHAQCAPPQDSAFGEGIYFAGTVKKAMEVWMKPIEEYVYFVEAEVLTGNSTRGEQGLILPPAEANSVSGGPDIAVIFSGHQALPKYIITCKAR
ncbi:protein mono-ADP-ribosyltransferase PARP9 isoform X2 [Notolabrus celidotus]|uniref:protein mono-ADP-ribosyltransferase PARP9 isoform X2 n=1 Tax=Notolabrus celidotus TaxID=1203425 RepID=UPI0014904A4B|nr:protein mono-ADP-ribosyltransferase PARP9 isoform X2 [Notolabrus celidotus]